MDGSGGFAVSREEPAAEPWPERLWQQHRDRLESHPGERPTDPPAEPIVPPSPFDGPIPPGSVAPLSVPIGPMSLPIRVGDGALRGP